jgi:hypothetical protein
MENKKATLTGGFGFFLAGYQAFAAAGFFFTFAAAVFRLM